MGHDNPAVQWRRLERQVTARIVSCDTFSAEARIVLLAVVKRHAGGGALPARSQLGEELGLKKYCMTRAVLELADAQLVRLERGAWSLDVEAAERWAAGELPTSENQTSEGLKISTPTSENQTSNRPAASLQVPPVVAPAAARTREAAVELDLAERQAVRALQDAGFRDISRADREDLRAWLVAGVTVEQIAYAARECSALRIRTPRYLGTILDRLHDEAAAKSEPVALDAYRGRGA